MKLKLCALVFLLVFMLSNNIKGQVNESDSLNFKTDLSITGFLQEGNVQTVIFRAVSNTSFKISEQILFKTQNSYTYQEFGKTKADEDILSLNFLYLNPLKKVYPLALGFISTNYRREIEIRYLLGAGASFRAVNNKRNRLEFSITSEFERTRFRSTVFNRTQYNGESYISTVRGTFWMKGRYVMLKDKIILIHESYYQPSLLERDNYRWRADIGVEFSMMKNFAFKVNYLQTFESVVMVNQKRRDKFLTVGFSVSSY
ncbi:MAG: DUF481 domain-containing protein [Balneolaceae bacterium]|nr:DUF481 domain-containing protein [Balneolaceae bacterium]